MVILGTDHKEINLVEILNDLQKYVNLIAFCVKHEALFDNGFEVIERNTINSFSQKHFLKSYVMSRQK